MLTLKTERVFLRPLELEDERILWPYVSNPEISRDMSWEPHQTLSDTRRFVNDTLESMKNGKSITWCIFFKDRFCGLFSLIGILKSHRALIYNKAELAYWIGPEYQGQGIMTEAGIKVIEYAFNSLHLNKLVVGHHIENKNSENLILRLGFKYLYTEEEVFQKGGKWITCKFYELKSRDYFKKKQL